MHVRLLLCVTGCAFVLQVGRCLLLLANPDKYTMFDLRPVADTRQLGPFVSFLSLPGVLV